MGDVIEVSLLYAKPYTVRTWRHVMSKVRRSRESDCWIWSAYVGAHGYGCAYCSGEMRLAHRVVFELFYGRIISPEREIDHLCGNKRCVNPHHLEQVTHEENMRRSLIGGPHWQRAKTHCPMGHPYDEVVTCRHPRRGTRTQRRCRTCRLVSQRAYKQRLKLQRLAGFLFLLLGGW